MQCSGTGSYTYYHDTGDYLGLHRDIEKCEVATITCLEDDGPESSAAGFRAYPRICGPAAARIYERAAARARIADRPGDTIVIAGGHGPARGDADCAGTAADGGAGLTRHGNLPSERQAGGPPYW